MNIICNYTKNLKNELKFEPIVDLKSLEIAVNDYMHKENMKHDYLIDILFLLLHSLCNLSGIYANEII